MIAYRWAFLGCVVAAFATFIHAGDYNSAFWIAFWAIVFSDIKITLNGK